MKLLRKIEWLKTILFLASIWVPLLLTIASPLQTTSASEQRTLTPFPSLNISDIQTFPDRFETFFDDHFGLRSPLVRGHNIMQVSLLKNSTSKRVIVGNDGWLFQNGNPHLSDIRNTWPFSEAELRHWANVLTLKQRWLESQGITYLFVICPSKHLIYPEMLPNGFRPVSPVSRMDQLVKYLEEHTDVPVVDLRPGLIKAKNKLRPYHKTDTHWNDYGAYIAYRQVMAAIKKSKRKVKKLKISARKFIAREVPGGDLSRLLNMQNDLREQSIELKEPVENCLKNTSLVVEEDNPDRLRNKKSFETHCSKGTGRLLMFRDSYSLAMMPYLSESFEYAFYVPHSPVPIQGIQRLVQEHHPDIVIEQRTSRWLRTPEG